MKATAMTRYIASYDTERHSAKSPPPMCLEACRAIVAMHKKHQMPATFFIVGKALESAPEEYRRLLDDPLFEIASHTYSHRMLKDNPICGKQIPPEDRREEIYRAKEVIDKVFKGRNCIGLRPGCSFVDGLKSAADVVKLVKDSGHQYVSSVAWGPDFTLPAPLNQAFTYAEEGFPEIAEYPCHGWHENLLKGNNRAFGSQFAKPMRVLSFPPLYPEAVPPGFVKTPEEEFHWNNKVFIDRAVKDKLDYVTLIWHPWSLAWFDPEMKMLDLTFCYVKEQGLKAMTFEQLHKEPIARNSVIQT
jgi:peptidoglycan/xylan/chitin deacetylase (PgdA/CDA1 family)